MVFQPSKLERLGSTHTRKVNVRLIAATNRDLEKMIAEREFRSDLYYRLNDVCRLALPNTVAGRLANLLLEWRKSPFKAGEAQSRFTISLTHEEIASMAATSRETVTRVFNQFEREKLISIKGVSLAVLQPDALEQMAM
jgi:CRP/FNR family transcriptional regulator